MAGTVKASNINILNAIRAAGSLGYSERIPVATQDNLSQIYDNLLNIMPLRNAFVEALVEQIMLQRVRTGYFKNPLEILKQDPMRYGMTEEEIFVNFAKGHTFDMFATEKELYQFYQAEVMSAYHRLSPPIQYPVTISYDNLRTAFRDEYGILTLINAKVQALFNGAAWDEYLTMKSLEEVAYEQGHIYPVHVNGVDTEADAKDFTKKIKAYIGQMSFPHPEFTIAGADSPADAGGIYILTTPEVDASLDVEVLAYAYENDYVKLKAHKILVDKFNDPDIQAVLFDMRFFNVRENFRTLTDSKNGAALSWNYFYTVSEMFSYSPFFQNIVFTKADVSTLSMSLQTGLSVNKGSTVTIPVTTTGTGDGYTPTAYRMEVTTPDAGRTAIIPGSNILSVDMKYAGSAVAVKATSLYDSSVTATTTVTVK